MKNKGFIIFVMLLCVCLCISASQQAVKQVQQKQVKTDLKQVQAIFTSSTDLRCEYIFASQCPCETTMKGVGVIYMPNVWVTITNYPCANGKKFNAIAEIRVTYFDMNQNKMVTRKATYSPLKPYPTNIWAKKVKVISTPILAKRSKGIKATVVIKNSDTRTRKFKDCNLRNNSRIIYKCVIPIVE